MKHGDTRTELEHTAGQEARHARIVAKPPAVLRMVEGLVKAPPVSSRRQIGCRWLPVA